MKNTVNNRYALVTGGAKRLGREMVLHLAQKGYNIILHCNEHYDEAVEVSRLVTGYGTECEILQCDFANAAHTADFIKNVTKKYSHIDVLINNSAIFSRTDLEHSDNELIDNLISINLKAPLLLIRDFASLLAGGLVINIIDAKILRPDSRYFIYSLCKKSLDFVTQLASQEFAGRFRVNSVSLGVILRNEKMADFEHFIDKIPLKNEMSVERLTSTVDFLIENSYVTGQTITVDGGYYNIIK